MKRPPAPKPCARNISGSSRPTADADELPDDIDRRLGEIETALAAVDERPVKFDPEDMARAGVFVSIDSAGALRIERGYVRPEDEPAVSPSDSADEVTDMIANEAETVEIAEPIDSGSAEPHGRAGGG